MSKLMLLPSLFSVISCVSGGASAAWTLWKCQACQDDWTSPRFCWNWANEESGNSVDLTLDGLEHVGYEGR